MTLDDCKSRYQSRPFAYHRNENGTYDGVGIFADLTGLSRDEIAWTWKRLRELLGQGKTKEQAKSIVAEESRQKPWEKPL